MRFAFATSAAMVSCSTVIGADEELTNVVDEMCICDELGFLGASCADTLDGRLRGATKDTRAEWLQRYAEQCTSCPTVLGCYYTTPTCSLAACQTSAECCGAQDGTASCDPALHECVSP
jgi:hypothetical protein